MGIISQTANLKCATPVFGVVSLWPSFERGRALIKNLIVVVCESLVVVLSYWHFHRSECHKDYPLAANDLAGFMPKCQNDGRFFTIHIHDSYVCLLTVTDARKHMGV